MHAFAPQGQTQGAAPPLSRLKVEQSCAERDAAAVASARHPPAQTRRIGSPAPDKRAAVPLERETGAPDTSAGERQRSDRRRNQVRKPEQNRRAATESLRVARCAPCQRIGRPIARRRVLQSPRHHLRSRRRTSSSEPATDKGQSRLFASRRCLRDATDEKTSQRKALTSDAPTDGIVRVCRSEPDFPLCSPADPGIVWLLGIAPVRLSPLDVPQSSELPSAGASVASHGGLNLCAEVRGEKLSSLREAARRLAGGTDTGPCWRTSLFAHVEPQSPCEKGAWAKQPTRALGACAPPATHMHARTTSDNALCARASIHAHARPCRRACALKTPRNTGVATKRSSGA